MEHLTLSAMDRVDPLRPQRGGLQLSLGNRAPGDRTRAERKGARGRRASAKAGAGRKLRLRGQGAGAGKQLAPRIVGNERTEVADRFRADERGERSGSRQRQAVQKPRKKTRGPGIAGAVGVDGVGHADGFDAMQFPTLRDPRAVASDFDRGDRTARCELTGQFVVAGGAVGEERPDFVLVGEDHVETEVELAEQPVARGVNDFKGREVEAHAAAGGAGRGENGIRERGVEREVAFDVGVANAGKIGGRDFRGIERDGGAEIGAHGALGVGRDEREAAGVGLRPDFEPAAVNAGGFEGLPIAAGEVVVAQFAEEGRAEAEARGVVGGVGRGTAGGGGGGEGEQRDDALHLRGVDEHHAAFVAGDLAEEYFRHGCEQIHDRRTDADEIKGMGGGGRRDGR